MSFNKILHNHVRVRGVFVKFKNDWPRMTTNKHFELRMHHRKQYAGCRVDGGTVLKQVHRAESRMEYHWELRSKNSQNIKALMCPLYKNVSFEKKRV